MSLSIFDAARETPGAPAFISGSSVLSYQDIAERARRVAGWLFSRPDRSRPVAFVAESHLDSICAFHACICLGVPVVLLHPRWTELERRRAMGDAEALEPEAALAGPPWPGPLLPIADVERCLAVVFTGGTTGAPKGVELSRRAFVASARASAMNLGWRDTDRWLMSLPYSHVGGLSILTRCLLARSTVVLGGRGRFDPQELLRRLEKDQVTQLSLVPSQLRLLLDVPDARPPRTLRTLLIGGAALPPALGTLARERGWPVLATYGLSEACSQVATQRPGTPSVGLPPLPGVRLRIVEGVIHVHTPALFTRYTDGSAPSPDGWFATGDLGRLNPEGHLEVLGRKDDVIVTGGEKVHPSEVEAVLEACPGVSAACVFGVPSSMWGEWVAAAVVSQAGRPSDELLDKHLEDHLARYKRPRRILHLDALPLTPAGKVDRRALRQRALGETSFP